MARKPSIILTAAELKIQKKVLKTEIGAHAASIKSAETAIKAAQKALLITEKTADAAMATAVKAAAATVKAVRKEYEATLKAQSKIIDGATKLGVKAEAKVAALVPAAPATVAVKPGLVTA